MAQTRGANRMHVIVPIKLIQNGVFSVFCCWK